MGPNASTTIVYVGTARLPQPLPGPAGSLAVELVVEPGTGRVVATATNLALPSLDRLIWEVAVGARVADAPEKLLLEIEVRYCSPLTAAVCRALESALRRAQQDACHRMIGRDLSRGAVASSVATGGA